MVADRKSRIKRLSREELAAEMSAELIEKKVTIKGVSRKYHFSKYQMMIFFECHLSGTIYNPNNVECYSQVFTDLEIKDTDSLSGKADKVVLKCYLNSMKYPDNPQILSLFGKAREKYSAVFGLENFNKLILSVCYDYNNQQLIDIVRDRDVLDCSDKILACAQEIYDSYDYSKITFQEKVRINRTARGRPVFVEVPT